MLSGDFPANAEQRRSVGGALYGREYMLSVTEQRTFVGSENQCPAHGLDEVRKFYEKLTMTLIQQKSHKLRHLYTLDAVRE